jgi:hypothetical protein
MDALVSAIELQLVDVWGCSFGSRESSILAPDLSGWPMALALGTLCFSS